MKKANKTRAVMVVLTSPRTRKISPRKSGSMTPDRQAQNSWSLRGRRRGWIALETAADVGAGIDQELYAFARDYLPAEVSVDQSHRTADLLVQQFRAGNCGRYCICSMMRAQIQLAQR